MNKVVSEQEVRNFVNKHRQEITLMCSTGTWIGFDKEHDAYLYVSGQDDPTLNNVRSLVLRRHDGREYDGINNYFSLEPFLAEVVEKVVMFRSPEQYSRRRWFWNEEEGWEIFDKATTYSQEDIVNGVPFSLPVPSGGETIVSITKIEALKELWSVFDVPVDEKENIVIDYQQFPAGTNKFTVWKWFSEKTDGNLDTLRS